MGNFNHIKEDIMSERKLAVSGQFYPNDQKELQRYLEHFNQVLNENHISIDTTLDPRAIIVPHAGYIYSGFTANLAYKYIPNEIENIIVIGPSHRYSFDGASIALYDRYPTPFGVLEINQKLSNKLMDQFEFLNFYDEVHQEHSTETQFPFIKYYSKDKKVIEIIYSKCDYQDISKIIEELLKDLKNFIVISTDLSHFYTLAEANKKDKQCISAISSNDVDSFNKECEACGLVGVKGLIQVTNKLDYKIKLLDYRTSADVSNDTKSVVGYSSFVIFSK
jgi:MEMO1 family protein